MADYKERFEKWQREAKERFEEIDKQLGIKEKIESGAKAAKETAKKSAETLKESANKIKAEAEKSEVGKQAVKAAEETAKKVYEASAPVRDAAGEASEKAADAVAKTASEAEKTIKDVGKKAGEIFAETRKSVSKNARRASKAFNLGASWTRAFDSAIKTFRKTTEWVAESPLQAATTGVSMAVGAGLGVVFTGVSSHWFFNSALPTSVVKKIAEQFDDYLKNQEELIQKGDLSKAEAERVKFERDIAKRVGAPLLGAFSFASGAVLMTNVLNPKTVTGAPIEWFLGGNPMLEGIWFFGNGIMCFKTSYDFFMIALEDQEDVQNIVKELKGLLPQTAQA